MLGLLASRLRVVRFDRLALLLYASISDLMTGRVFIGVSDAPWH